MQEYNFHFSGFAQCWFTVQADTYAEAIFKAHAMKEDRRDEVEDLEIIGLNFDMVRVAGVWQEDENGELIDDITYDTDLIDLTGFRAVSIFVLERLLNILKTWEFSRYYKLKSKRARRKNRKRRDSL